jgi:hypothetical protein
VTDPIEREIQHHRNEIKRLLNRKDQRERAWVEAMRHDEPKAGDLTWPMRTVIAMQVVLGDDLEDCPLWPNLRARLISKIEAMQQQLKQAGVA